MSDPAMLSVITVTGILSCISSHAVNRAPCSTGLVSSAMTLIFFPSSHAALMTPRAVPYPAVARAPALQCVRMVCPLPDQFRAVASHRFAQLDILLENRLRFFSELVLDLHRRSPAKLRQSALHPFDRPE